MQNHLSSKTTSQSYGLFDERFSPKSKCMYFVLLMHNYEHKNKFHEHRNVGVALFQSFLFIPLLRDHLQYKTTICRPKEWSYNPGTTVQQCTLLIQYKTTICRPKEWSYNPGTTVQQCTLLIQYKTSICHPKGWSYNPGTTV